jgi:predicted metal-binding protein
MPGGVPWQLGGRLIGQVRGRCLAPFQMALAPEDASTVSDGVDVPLNTRPQLYICVSCRCRGADAVPEGEQTDGRRLYEAVKSLADDLGEATPVHVLPTLCFANCERGCSAGITAPGKWSYLVGELGPDYAADLLIYAEAYAKTKTGVVLPSGRPASLQMNVIARFPAPFEPAKDAAE